MDPSLNIQDQKKTLVDHHDLKFESGFLHIRSTSWERKERIDDLDIIKLTISVHKHTLSRRRRGILQNVREYLQIISDKGLLSQINNHS